MGKQKLKTSELFLTLAFFAVSVTDYAFIRRCQVHTLAEIAAENVRFNADAAVAFEQVVLFALVCAMEKDCDFLPFAFKTERQRNNIRIFLIKKRKPYNLTPGKNFKKLILICNFPFASSHRLSPQYRPLHREEQRLH